MPFTNVWDNTRPAGTVQAKEIDNEIRTLRVDIDERMEASLFVDWGADPLVLKDEVKGKKLGLKRFVDFSMFNAGPAGAAIPEYNSVLGSARVQQDTGPYIATLTGIIPVGCTIKSLFWLLDRATSNTATMTLVRADIASGVRNATVVDTITVNAGATGFILRASNALNILIADNKYYWLRVVLSGGVGNSYIDLAGVQIVFDRPTVQEAT